MNCPECFEVLEQVSHNNFWVDQCVHCEGIWMAKSSLRNLLARHPKAPGMETLQPILDAIHDSELQRYCPKCPDQKLGQIQLRGPKVDICRGCSGLFFDANELKALIPSLKRDWFRGQEDSLDALEDWSWIFDLFEILAR